MLFQDFQLGGTLAAGGQDYLLLGVDTGASTLRFGFTGLLGGPFEDATRPQLTLLRIR
jgi:hypothetical protein